jgi:hypothetical protein
MSGFDERDRLSRALQERSEDVGGHPIGLDDVKGTARRIRRRRTAAGLAAAAVVLAVGVPVGFAATGTSADRAIPVAQATPSTSASPSATVSPTVTPPPTTAPATPSQSPVTSTPDASAAVPLTARGAATGAAPRVGYLQGDRLHNGDGTVQTLPAAYTNVTSFHGGWLAATFKQGETSVLELDGSDRVVASSPGSDSFALSQDGTMVSWFTVPGQGKTGSLWSADLSGMGNGRSSTSIPAGTQVTPIGWVRTGVVYEAFQQEAQVWTTDFAGHTRQLPGLIAATGALQSDDLVAGQTSSSGTGSCWTVMVAGSGKRLWNTCDFALGRFSPDGRYVIGTDAYADGAGGRTVAILDAHTGKVVEEYRVPDSAQAFTGDSAWEENGNLLTILNEDGAWHMLRLSPHGQVQQALAPVPGTVDNGAPWRFTARP